jgi:probable rRNA maturation factor
VSNIPANNLPNPQSVQVEITIDHHAFQEPLARLIAAAQAAAHYCGRFSGTIEVTVVDDPTIHKLNREQLQHDWPTDVISFVYDDQPDCVEGEIIVSWDTAQRVASGLHVPPMHELLLYIVHGTLHLCGLDDIEATDQALMRTAEASVLRLLGIDPSPLVGAASC